MKYPIFIHNTGRKTVMAICPVIKDFYAEGSSVEEALKLLNDKFVCFLHDDKVELEIISIERKTSSELSL
ncbi:MAG: hypothetical protein AB1633_00805 [Elusimicrobiota bacterium]